MPLASPHTDGGRSGKLKIALGIFGGFFAVALFYFLLGSKVFAAAPTVSSIAPTNGSAAGGTSVTITGTNFISTPEVGIVALWHMDELSGASVGDSSLNGDIGTANGTTIVAGKYGNGRSFNGTSDYVGIPWNSIMNPGNNFTISAWVYQSTLTGGSIISTRDVNNGVATKGYALGIFTGASNGLRTNSLIFSMGNPYWGWSQWTSAANSMTVGWHFVAVTVANASTANKTVLFYIDGVSSAAAFWTGATQSTGNFATNVSAARIGGSYTASYPAYETGFYTGVIDDLTIYSTIRSAAQITAAYTAIPSTVTFGGIPATGLQSVNATTMTATTPPHAAGLVDVVASIAGQSSAPLSGGYTYNPPPGSFTIIPSSVLITGGDSVTITGTNFVSGATIKFGSVAAQSVTFINSTTLTAVTPVQSAGTYDVVITNPDGQSATLTKGIAFTELPPGISSISPNIGPIAGGTSVAITGTNFRRSNVTPNPNSFPTTWYVSTAGSDATGTGSLASPFASLYQAINIAVSGDAIDILPGTYRAILFRPTVSATCINDLGKQLTIFGSNNSTVLECYGADSLSGSSRDANVATLSNAATVVSNMKINFYPNRGINYSNAIFKSSFGTFRNVYFENKSGAVQWSYDYDNSSNPLVVVNSVFNSNGYATTDASGAPTYVNDLYDYTPSLGTKTYSLTRAIAAADWDISSSTPSTLLNVGSSTILNPDNTRSNIGVRGGLYSWEGFVPVTFGGISLSTARFINANTVQVITPAHSAGAVDVTVSNPDGQSATLTGGYTYLPAPGITSITPSSVLKTGGNAVTVSGSNFFASSTVSFGGVFAQSVIYVDSSTLSVVTPVQNMGTYNVVVTNPDGQIATLANGITFTNPPPGVSSIAPNNGPAAGGTSVTITGAGFIPPNNGGSAGWTTTTGTLPAILAFSQLAVIGSNIYLFGGYTGSVYTNAIYTAPVSNPTAWTIATGTLPATLALSQLAVIGSNIYLFGGLAGGSAYTNAIYTAPISNPTAWTIATGTLPVTLARSQSTVIGSNIYIFGGLAGGAYTSTIYIAPISNPTAWTIATGTLPAALAHSQSVVIGSNIYLFGGIAGGAYTNAIYTAPVSNPTAWTIATGTLPVALVYFQSAVIGSNIYLFGGLAGGSVYTSTIYIAPISNPTAWTIATGKLPAALARSQSTVIGSNIYLFGGYTGSVYTNAIYTAPATNNQSTVTIGGIAATNVNFMNATTITATTPAHIVGSADVVVANYDGQSSTLSGGYTYNAPPGITSITPSSVIKTGGNAVTISGSNFFASSTVSFGSVSAQSVTYVDFSTLSVVTPVQNTGTYNVVVTNPDGQIATLANGITFTNLPPSLTSIAPTNGSFAGGTSVTISGMNFAGIAATSTNFASSTNYPVGTNPYSIAIGDLNGDGKLDLVAANSSGNTVSALLGNGDGTFGTRTTYPVGTTPYSVVIGDLNGDGRPDLAVANSGGSTASVLLGNGDGTFGAQVTYSVGAAPRFVARGDLNSDGKPDLAVANVGSSTVSVLLGNGDGTFGTQTAYPVGTSPRFVAIGDLNSDGKPDLVAANSGGTTVSILLGTGTGTFGSQTTYPVGTNPYSVAIGDLNGDGKPDLVVANTGGTTASVLLGTGTGTFGTQTTYPVGASPYSAAMSDLNGDGKLDLAVANYSNNTASILLGKGDGTFGTQTTYPVGANPYFVAMSDLNGDGKLDLAVANVGSSTVSILINTTMMLAIPTVTFGGISATSVQFVNSSAITATTPAHAFGPVDVVVKNADGQSATLSGGYTYNAPPGIVSVTPSSVLKTGGDAVTISGFNFFASSTVSFGGVSAQSVTYVNSSTLSVVTPVQNTGTYNVVVTNPDGQIATLTNGITFMNPPPSVISIAPNNGSAAGGTSVTITGSGFVPPNSGGSTGWTAATGTLPATLVYSHLAVIGNNIYLFGGNASGSLAKSIYVAPVSNPTAWTIATGTLPATLSDSDLVVIGSNIYLFGGYAAGVFTKAIYVASVSNPTVWTTATGTLPTTLGDAQSAVIGSNIYFFGGYASGYTSTIYVAPVSNPTAWTIATGTIPATVVYSQLAVIGSHIYLFGGYNGVGYTKAIYTASISNPTVWTTATGTLPTTLSGSQLAVIGSNIYLFGGIASSSATNAIYTASISNPTVWTTATGTLPATLYYSQSAVIGNNIYLFGGIASSSATKAIYTAPATNNQSTVTIGGVAATNINFANTTTITASTTAHAVGPVDVVVTNYDGQSSTLSGGYTYNPDRIAIISSSLNQQEGQPGMMTVQAQDVNGNAGPVATDTVVQLSSTAATGFFARNINEDISTRWNYNSVVIPAGQSSVNFYYMDNLKGTPTISVSSAVIITGASQQETITSKYRFLVVGATNPVKQGIPSSITVQAIDYNGIPLAGYAGTMRFTATDARAIVPSNFAITPAMLGGYTFVNGVTMLTQGTWCVTATDVSDANITGSQCGIVVTPPNTGVAAQLAIITSPQFISTTGTSTPITVQMQDASGTPSISNTTTTIYIFSDSATASYSANGTIGWRAQPLTLTIPAGASSINFFYRDSTIGTHILTAGDDATQGADFGLINAAQTETITVGDAYSISVSAALHSINAGSSTAVTMTLHDSAGNIVSSAINQPIYLSGTNGAQVATSSAGPWSSILGTTIGVGQTAVTAYVSNTTAGAFTITASDNNPADGATGLIDGTDRVTVAPGLPTTFAFTTSMFQMTAGQVSAAITVAMWDQFGNAATSTTGTKLYLFADQPGALFSANAGFSSTATNVTIPAGQSNVTFYLKQSIYGAATTTITVSDNAVAPDGAAGIADVAQAESIIPGAMYQFVITSSSPIAAVAGAQTPVVAFIKNSYGVVIPFSSATTIYLRTTSVASLAQFSAQPDPSWLPITSIVAPIGTTSTLFYYEDTGAGNPVITIADEPTGSDTGIVNATAQFAIVSSAPSALTFTTQPFSIQAGEVSPALTVRTQDQYGNAVTKTTSTLVAITSTSGGGGFDTSSGGVFAKTNITIPAGQSTATFYYKDVIVGTSTITAFASGFTSATQGEIVTAGTVAALHLLIGSSTIMAGTVAGPITATFINGFGVVIPAPSNVMVNVSSSAASGFFDTNPIGAFDGGATSVFIPQNATSVIFYYRDTKAGLATVTASGLGFAGTLVLAISPGAANSLAITSAPFSIQVGQVSPQMTVLLQDQYGNTASSSAPLFLIPTTTSGVGKFATSSSGSFTATQIKIPAGQTSVSMFYKDSIAGTPTITIAASGTTPVSQTETVNWGNPTALVVSPTSSTLSAGEVAGPFVVTLVNSNGITIPVSSTVALSLTTTATTTGDFDTSAGGAFDGSITSIVIPQNATSATFYYRDTKAGSATVTASGSGVAANVAISILPGPASVFTMNSTPFSIQAGQISPQIVVSLQDQYGNVASSSTSITMTLSTTSGVGRFATSSGDSFTATHITILAGQTSASFYYEDFIAGTPTITVGASGITSASQTETVNWGNPTALVISPMDSTLSAGEVAGPFVVTFVNSNGIIIPASSTVIVNLTTTASTTGDFDTSAGGAFDGTVTSVVIPQNATSATFYYRDTKADVAILTAGGLGFAANAIVVVLPGPASTFTINSVPFSIQAGQISPQIVIFLQDQYGNATPSSTSITVTLTTTSGVGKFATSSSGSFTATQIKIPAGQTSASFYYEDFIAGTPTITVTASGITSASQTEAVNWGTATALMVSPTSSTLSAGEVAGPFVVTLVNSNGITIPASSSITANLSSSAGTGFFDTSAGGAFDGTITSVVIPQNATSATFYYRDTKAGSATVTASSSGVASTSVKISIVPAVADRLMFAPVSGQTLVLGQKSAAIVISISDQFGNAVTFATSTVVSFNTTSEQGTFLNGSNQTTTQVTIPAGQVSATFYYTDFALGSSAITAHATGLVDATQTEIITYGVPTSIVIAASSTNLIAGDVGGPFTATIVNSFGQAVPAQGATMLALSSNAPSGKFDTSAGGTFDGSVTSIMIPSGQVSGTFYYTDTAPGSPRLTASSGGLGAGSINVNVIAGVPASMVFLNAQRTTAAGSASAAFTLEFLDSLGNVKTLTSPVTVTLTTSATSTSGFAASAGGPWTTTQIIVPAGVATANFYYRDTIPGTKSIGISASGLTGASQNTVITPGLIDHFIFTTAPQTLAILQPSTAMTVQAIDTLGNITAPTSDLSIKLLSTSPQYQFSAATTTWTNINTITMHANQSMATFYYEDWKIGTSTITVRDAGSLYTAVTQAETIISGAPSQLLLSPGPQTVVASTPSGPITISLADGVGDLVASISPVTVTITGSSPAALFTDDPAGTWQPSFQITFAPGEMIKTFYFEDPTVGTSTMTVSSLGLTSATQLATIIGGVPAQIALVGATTTTAGQPLAVTVQVQTASGLPVAVVTTTTIPIADNGGGQFSLTNSPWTPITSLTFSKGVAQKTVYFRATTAGSHTITANATGAGWGTATENVQVLALNVYQLKILSGPTQVVANHASTAFVAQTQDQYGNVVSISSVDTGGAGSVNVYLYGAGQFATSTIGPWGSAAIPMQLGDNTFSFYFNSVLPGAQTITVSDQTPTATPDTGWLNSSWSLTVLGETPTQLAFVNAPQTVAAGTSDQLTVQANKADGTPAILGSPLVVNLNATWVGGKFSLTNATSATAITQVTIPIGKSSTTFYGYSTLVGSYIISAVASGITSASQTFVVTNGAPATLAFVSAPQSVQAGADTTQMHVVLKDQYGNTATSTSDTTISFTSTDGGQFSLNSDGGWVSITGITIPAGSADIYFYFRNGGIMGTYQVKVLDGSGKGLSTATQNVVVAANAISHIVLATTAFSVMKGQPSPPISFIFQDQFGNIVSLPTSKTLYIYSSSASSTFSATAGFASSTTLFTLPAGAAGGTFYYKDLSSGTPTITVSDASPLDAPDTGWQNAIQAETIVDGSPFQFKFVDAPTSIQAGDARAFQLQVQNQYGVPVAPAALLTASLYSTSGLGRFSLTTSFQPSDFILNVVFSSGQNAKTFYYRDTTAGTPTVTASDQSPLDSPDVGIVNATRAQSVLSASVASINFLNAPVALEVGQASGALTVQLRDQFGNAVVADAPVTVYPYTNSAQGGFATSINTTSFTSSTQFIIPVGVGAISFYYKDLAVGNPVITVSDASPLDAPDVGLVNAIQTESVAKGNIFRIAFITTPQSLEAGAVSQPITLELQNNNNVPRPVDANTSIYLTSSNTQGQFALSPVGPWNATSVIVLAGNADTNIYYRQLAAGSASITASDGTPPNGPIGWLDGTQNVAVNSGAPAQIVIISSPASVIAHHPSAAIAIDLENAEGAPISATSTTRFYLRSSVTDSNDKFAASPQGPWGINFIDMPAGATETLAYFTGITTGSRTLSVADELPMTSGVGLVDAQADITILPQTMDHFLVANISNPEVQGSPSTVIVEPQDAGGYIYSDYAGTICFTASDADAIIPDCYLFDPTIDHGIHDFGNGVAFLSPGLKSVTVKATTGGYAGVQSNITVLANTAGKIAAVKFTNLGVPPISIPKNQSYGPITMQLFDANSVAANAPAGGYPILVTSNSPAPLFSLGVNGPWTSQLAVDIPAGLSSLNFYYKDGTSGIFTVAGSDFVNGVDDSAIANDSFTAAVSGISVHATTTLETYQENGAPPTYVINPILFDEDGGRSPLVGEAIFDVAVANDVGGAAVPATLTFVLKDPSGNIKDTQTTSTVTGTFELPIYFATQMISPHIIIAKVPADSGTWTETITATDSSNRTVTTVVPFVVSDWIAYQDYPVGYVQLGAPVNATITAQKSGVLTDVAGLTIRWLDQGMITTTSSIVGTMADVTSHPSAGVYRVAIPTAQGLSVGSEYHSTLRILDASGTILASDYHADIMIINNPALAPKNFAVEKILTSIPPAPETYDLKFTWDQSANASGYNLYRSQSKFSTLYDDSCTIAQVQDGDRAAGNCEKTIHMDTDATDDTTHWVQQAALTSGGTRTYTVKNAQNLPGSEYFFILRANNGAIESGLSSMTFVNKLNFAYNAADGASNVNWISIPYVADFYTNAASTLMTASLIQASIVVRDVEIGTGINTNQKIDRVSLWDPVSQGIIGNYAYRAGGAFNRWMGTDFMIAPGSGIFLETSGNTPTFNWTTVGSDDQNPIVFAYNGSGATNVNWVSLPYSGMYTNASDIVTDIEGGIGANTDQKIDRISLWDPVSQGIVGNYAYRAGGAFNRWMGNNFVITPGSGVFIEMSGNTPTFTWTPALLVNPNQ